jgi:hypothetical protein
MDYFDGLKTAIRTVKDHVDARMPSFAWGEVTQVSPVVLVVPDNAAAALEASTLAPLSVGDRVWFVRYSGRVVIVGVAKGVPVPAPATQAEVDAGIVSEAYVSPATLAGYTPASDRPWARIDATTYGPAIASLGTGFVHDSDPFYDGLHARIKDGVLYITGRLSRASFVDGAVLFNVATAFRPERPMVQYSYSAGHNFAVAQPDGVTIIALAGTNGCTIGFSWPLK